MKRRWWISLALAGLTGVGVTALAAPDRYAAWRQEHSLATTHITYVRTPCAGGCPSYQVDIFGDGRVIYQGFNNVAVKGAWTYHVPRDSLQAWLTDFRVSGFWTRRRSPATDAAPGSCRVIMKADRRSTSNGCYDVTGDDGMSLETPSLAADITQMEAVIHLDSLVSGQRLANIVPGEDAVHGLKPYKIKRGT